jgi:hypothetical protein
MRLSRVTGRVRDSIHTVSNFIEFGIVIEKYICNKTLWEFVQYQESIQSTGTLVYMRQVKSANAFSGINLDDPIASDGNNMPLLARLDRVGRAEYVLELLEGTTISLDSAEVPDESFDAIPADEDKDILEADTLRSKCDSYRVLSKKGSSKTGKRDSRPAKVLMNEIKLTTTW